MGDHILLPWKDFTLVFVPPINVLCIVATLASTVHRKLSQNYRGRRWSFANLIHVSVFLPLLCHPVNTIHIQCFTSFWVQIVFFDLCSLRRKAALLLYAVWTQRSLWILLQPFQASYISVTKFLWNLVHTGQLSLRNADTVNNWTLCDFIYREGTSAMQTSNFISLTGRPDSR